MSKPPIRTHTAGWPIGFRRARTAWQQDLPALLDFAAREGFAFIDFGPVDVTAVHAASDAGLRVGTVDLLDWQALLSHDVGRRSAAVLANAQHIRSHVAAGVRRFLTVLTPAEPAAPRRENFAAAVEAYRSLAEAAGECGAQILLEGAPGRPPHFANLGCTPADLRAFLEAVGSNAVSVNFDPSHLVRMGIDPVRFVREFGPRFGHVHAKDVLFGDALLYEHGTLQQATFFDPPPYAGPSWRYVLPGRGSVPWAAIGEELQKVGYAGDVSIELEDADYLTDAAAEQAGLRQSAGFLQPW